MKALTISQPYASMIASGEKWVENRTWATDYRGWLAIHAGKGQQYLSAYHLRGIPTGCVVAVAELAACLRLEDLKRRPPSERIAGVGKMAAEVLKHKHAEGPYCWILGSIWSLKKPFPVSGKQGLWEVDPSGFELPELCPLRKLLPANGRE